MVLSQCQAVIPPKATIFANIFSTVNEILKPEDIWYSAPFGEAIRMGCVLRHFELQQCTKSNLRI